MHYEISFYIFISGGFLVGSPHPTKKSPFPKNTHSQKIPNRRNLAEIPGIKIPTSKIGDWGFYLGILLGDFWPQKSRIPIPGIRDFWGFFSLKIQNPHLRNWGFVTWDFLGSRIPDPHIRDFISPGIFLSSPK